MSFLTTNPSPYLINVPEFQNVVTSAVGDVGLSNTILNFQTLLNIENQSANLNTIGSVDGASAITVRNDLNLSNTSIQFLGSNLLTSNVLNGAGGYIAFEVIGTEIARLTSDGFGIGTTTPVGTLDVAGSATIRGLLTIADGAGISLGTEMGSVVGTDSTQKVSFWGATPDVQPTTAIGAATFSAGSSGIMDDSATYGGYTMGQVVAALQRAGLLA